MHAVHYTNNKNHLILVVEGMKELRQFLQSTIQIAYEHRERDHDQEISTTDIAYAIALKNLNIYTEPIKLFDWDTILKRPDPVDLPSEDFTEPEIDEDISLFTENITCAEENKLMGMPVEELLKQKTLGAKLLLASKEAFDKYGTPSQIENEEFRNHWAFCPNLITQFINVKSFGALLICMQVDQPSENEEDNVEDRALPQNEEIVQYDLIDAIRGN